LITITLNLLAIGCQEGQRRKRIHVIIATYAFQEQKKAEDKQYRE